MVEHHLLGEEVGANGGLVLVAELLVDILVHQGGFAHAAVPQDDHLRVKVRGDRVRGDRVTG